MIRSSSLPTWATPLLLVACATDLFAQRPPFAVFPPANPPYYRVRYEASAKPGELAYPVVPRRIPEVRPCQGGVLAKRR
jgi:hypothetical protein